MKAAGFTHDNKDNASVDWYTPPWVFQRLGLDFDLDPCQPPDGIEWIPAKRRYSIHDDGLTSPWAGRVWLNPIVCSCGVQPIVIDLKDENKDLPKMLEDLSAHARLFQSAARSPLSLFVVQGMRQGACAEQTQKITRKSRVKRENKGAKAETP